jgi:hypothetical protein
MTTAPNNSLNNSPRLDISIMKNRKCKFKKCNNIILFDINEYCENNYCFKHNKTHLYRKIEHLEQGFFDNKQDYDFIIPKKEYCNSISYLNKMIQVVDKIIHLRKNIFLKNNKKNKRGHFSYRCLDLIFAYTYFLNILLNFKKYLSKGTILNDGFKLPIIKITGKNYLKYDKKFYFRDNLLNVPIQAFDYNIINTFDSLQEFHRNLHIIPYEKDILKIKKNLEKYYLEIFENNHKNELLQISIDSINIIKNYYNNNLIYDDYFNQVYLRKKILNNEFLKNIIILTDRLNTKVYFFHKNK